ncbi:MAG: HAD family acid phosphatase, partial [Planctomycetota bacterium]
MQQRRNHTWIFLLVGLVASPLVLLSQVIGPVPVVVGTKPENPSGRSIDSNLYMQTAAEHRAACHQAFNLATMRLQQKLCCVRDRRPVAVVLDLDETVLDNGAFQTAQTRAGVQWEKFRKSTR